MLVLETDKQMFTQTNKLASALIVGREDFKSNFLPSVCPHTQKNSIPHSSVSEPLLWLKLWGFLGPSKCLDFEYVRLALYIDPKSVPTSKRSKFRTVLNTLGVAKGQLSEWATFVAQTMGIPGAFKNACIMILFGWPYTMAPSPSQHINESNSLQFWMPSKIHLS